MAAVMRKPVGGSHQPSKPPPVQYNQLNAHGRTRTNSSNTMSTYDHTYPSYAIQGQSHPPPVSQNRRTLSNATSSTSSSNTNPNHSSAYSVPRRSTSSRSNSSISPSSYVALMRKQKATVWCDRAQHEDPRILVAQRQARMRAAAEVAGGHGYHQQSRTSTSSSGVVGGVRSKIRHHGAPKASAYNASLSIGAGVPMRLSASEVDDGNNSDEETDARRYHSRNGSGRSSAGSGKRGPSAMASSARNGNTPPGASPVDSIGEEQTPMPRENSISGEDYFVATAGSGASSVEQEESFGDIGGLPNTGKLPAEERIKRQQNAADDLKRRGSVDERTMTMSGPRLFVANPDLSD